MYLLAPFILQNFKNVLKAGPELWRCAHLSWAIFFLVQTIISTSIYLLALLIVQNLKEFLQQIQSYEDALFFGKLLISLSSTC